MVSRMIKEGMIVFLGMFAVLYLIVPTLGIFELVPDAIPIVGSIDEAAATAIVLNTLNYYGLDFTNLYGKRTRRKKVRRVIEQPPEEGSE